MSDFAQEVVNVHIEEEMRQSYLDYAMSVIVGRALPDVRDGLKPVHRRVLFSMHENSNDWNKAHVKSARIVGDVMGKYHPHGDSAIYDTMVRMAQPFSMRHVLIDGQGNFGSIDGDSAAAMRYTEARMSKLAHELLADIDKETVDFVPNYDGKEKEPSVLPARVPNLLVNGAAGIAVGMATNIPPHNLTETINATLCLLDDPAATLDDLMEHLPAPDFPTAGLINGTHGMKDAYATGRGRVVMRARTHIETDEKTGKDSIIVTEIPYQVNKARLIERIAELVKDKKIEGISELRDESDKDGMRIVIEVRRGEQTEVLINNLYQQTAMQSSFGINMVALVGGQPKLLGLQQILDNFIRHRREVVTRRTIFELRKARDRAHVLEGLAVALSNIDPVIELIKAAKNPAEAREALMAKSWPAGLVADMLAKAGAAASRPDGLPEHLGYHDGEYWLSEVQARAILDMQLQRLTGLEQEKIIAEYSEIILKIEELLEILRNPERLREVIREELEAIRDQYGEPRRTEISADYSNLSQEDLIPETDMVVTLSHEGYIKAQPLDDYQTQRRGGRGKSATSMKDNDFIDKLFVASSHDMCLFFTSRGRVYWRKVYQLPAASRGSKGRPIINVLPLQENERVNTTLAVRDFPDDQFVFFATRNGVVKKTALSAFSRPLASGIIAVDLRQDDYLVKVDITDGTKDVMLISADGQAMRFNENDVRAMGRTAAGVRGIRLKNAEDHVVALIVCDDDSQVLTATEMGNGKRTHITEYPCKGRGGQGVIDIKTEDRNGKVIGAVKVAEDADVMLITNGGTLVRTKVAEVREVSRNTYGVSLIRLTKGEKLVEIAAVPFTETDEEEPVEGNEPIDGDAGASAGANTQASEDTSEPPTSEGDDA